MKTLLIFLTLVFVFCQETELTTDIVIVGGTIVNAHHMEVADVLIKNGKIHQIGKNLAYEKGTKLIDATDKYIMPGGIDTHVHFELPFMGTVSADDFYTGTSAALSGGTTMICKSFKI